MEDYEPQGKKETWERCEENYLESESGDLGSWEENGTGQIPILE